MVAKCSNLITRPTSGSLAIVQCLMRDFPEDSGIFHIRIVNTTSQRYWDFLFIYFHDNWSQDRLTKLTTGNFLLAIVNDPWMITCGVEIIFPSFWRHCHGSHYYPCPADSAGCCDTWHHTCPGMTTCHLCQGHHHMSPSPREHGWIAQWGEVGGHLLMLDMENKPFLRPLCCLHCSFVSNLSHFGT